MVHNGRKMQRNPKMIRTTLIALLIAGCAKTASETATEAALKQTDAIQQTILKQCPQAQINEPIAALKATIQSQLAACESEKGKLKERNHTLMAILIGIIAVIIAFNWVKIKTKVFK